MTFRVWRSIGILLSIGVAFGLALLFHSSHIKPFLPFLFLGVIAVIALEFGSWSGMVATAAATIIFAEFLFEPIYSWRVGNLAQRHNLLWMAVLGLALSEIYGRIRPVHRKRGT